MARLKTYTLGSSGFVTPAIVEALGEPDHIRQAGVIAVAPTKADALQLLRERGFTRATLRDPDFRQATGNTVDALRDGGLLDKPGVLVTPMITRRGDWVVEVQPDGSPKRAGRLVQVTGYRYQFEAGEK